MNGTVTARLALHKTNAASLMVSRPGELGRAFALPVRQIQFRILPGRHVEHGKRKLALLEVEMPAWLARDRGLA